MSLSGNTLRAWACLLTRCVPVAFGMNDDGRPCFPEVNANGETTAINHRRPDGKKMVGKGQHRGIYNPTSQPDGLGPTLLAEGVGDTAAALTMGLRVVGRPNCTGGAKILTDLYCDRND